jgi:GR25 family glycosyltransferase involved in LPS biosynthesis
MNINDNSITFHDEKFTFPLINVCFINLNKRTDRLNKISNHFEQLKNKNQVTFIQNIHRIEAIEDTTPSKGCMKSHKEAIIMAQEKSWPFVMVLEDDARFNNNIDESWINIMNDLKHVEWDIIFGATVRMGRKDATYFSDHLLCLTSPQGIFTGTHCMIYHSRSYKNIIKLIDDELKSNLPYHIDLLLSTKYPHNNNNNNHNNNHNNVHNNPKPNILLSVPFLALFNEHDVSDVRIGKDTQIDYDNVVYSQNKAIEMMNFLIMKKKQNNNNNNNNNN